MYNRIPRAFYYMEWWRPFRSFFQAFLPSWNKVDKVPGFEEAFKEKFNFKHVVATSHARISLYFCLKSHSFLEGQEVLMTPINLPDMVNVIRALGLKERFVDINKHDFSIDLNDARKKITPQSKFLFLTHLNGIVPNMDEITAFALEKNLILIQDCTQNVDCLYKGKKLEEFSELSFMSLCDLKVIHTHMGSMLISQNNERLDIIKGLMEKELTPLKRSYFFRFLLEDFIAVFILNRYFFSLIIYPFLSFFTKILGPREFENLTSGRGIKIVGLYMFKGLFGGGGNVLKKTIPKEMLYQYCNLQAKVGLARLEKFREIDQKRIENGRALENKINEKRYFPPFPEGSRHVFWKFPVTYDYYRDFQSYLFKRGVDIARSNLPCLSTVKEFSSNDKTPVAEYLVSHTVYIPIHPYIKEKEINLIADMINRYPFLNE
jgi:perosamine synthetase